MSRTSRQLDAYSRGMASMLAAAMGGTYRPGEPFDLFGNKHGPSQDVCMCWQCPKWDGVEWWQPKSQVGFTFWERRKYGLVKRANGGVMFKDESEA